MKRETLLLGTSDTELLKAASALRCGEVVGIPTETVYGLAADATNEEAVRKVFAAKGRPADNPLIVHLADFSLAEKYTSYIPPLAKKLAESFCPGPLTMVMPKNDRIPSVTSGGLDTVGIRVPSHPVMHRLLEISGLAIAAPSANRSGYPSPTAARHVMDDMNGKIFGVIDGGPCEFGVESTVISFDGESSVRILRPGCVTRNMLLDFCDDVIIDKAILSEVAAGEKVASPGMKYKHYSPRANVILVEGSIEAMKKYLSRPLPFQSYALLYEAQEDFPCPYLTYGSNSFDQARLVFQRLRELDDIRAGTVYVQAPSKQGVGLAVYNRLIRAAGFEVIRI
ncbi:MAG: threonylcarbamoyl-AMP synthase [Ruminococcus sp.]|nr:threonylcarbamoyl-AMP synthase [Ruminococcus sp.]